jgi:uncharacterized membrane protein (DUF106 family)
MLTVSNLLTALFGVIMSPFQSLPMTGMIVISVLTGVLMLIIYKYTSNQAGISRAKDRIKAHFLAIVLFSDTLTVLLKSIGNILKWNLVYLGHNIKPLLVMIVPVLLLLIQLNFWYGYRPLDVGESMLVTADIAAGTSMRSTKASLTADGGVAVETPAVRAVGKNQVFWRIKGTEPGEHQLTMTVGDTTETKRLVVGPPGRLYRLAPLRHNGNFADSLFYPGEKKLTGAIESIQVDYPGIEMNVFGWHIHWIIVYFILSILFGLSMKGLFKVDI